MEVWLWRSCPASFGLTAWNSDWYDHWTNKRHTIKHMVACYTYRRPTTTHCYLLSEWRISGHDNRHQRISGSNDPLFIGHQKETLFFFDGMIDEVRIYNRTLTAGEVKKLYEQFNR